MEIEDGQKEEICLFLSGHSNGAKTLNKIVLYCA